MGVLPLFSALSLRASLFFLYFFAFGRFNAFDRFNASERFKAFERINEEV